MALPRKVVALFLTLSIATIVFGILLVVFHTRIVRYQLSSDLILVEKSAAVKLWSKRPDFPVQYHVSFFNYSIGFKSYQLVGPYKFAFRRAKTNITFHGVDQVIYTEIKTYDLDASGDFSLVDKINTHDPATDALMETTVSDVIQAFFPNNTETRFVIKSGYSQVEKTGFVINVNGSSFHDNKFYGYNVGPNVKQSSVIYYFDADFCFTNAFRYVASHTINGTDVLRFMHDDKEKPEKEGCVQDIPYEIVEMGKDQLHMPSYFDVEPFTGWIMRSAFRRQINSKSDAAAGKGKGIISYEELAEAEGQTSEEVDDFVFYKARLINSVAGYFVLAGVVMLLILLTAHLRSKRAHAEVTTPVDVAPESMFKL